MSAGPTEASVGLIFEKEIRVLRLISAIIILALKAVEAVRLQKKGSSHAKVEQKG